MDISYVRTMWRCMADFINSLITIVYNIKTILL